MFGFGFVCCVGFCFGFCFGFAFGLALATEHMMRLMMTTMMSMMMILIVLLIENRDNVDHNTIVNPTLTPRARCGRDNHPSVDCLTM